MGSQSVIPTTEPWPSLFLPSGSPRTVSAPAEALPDSPAHAVLAPHRMPLQPPSLITLQNRPMVGGLLLTELKKGSSVFIPTNLCPLAVELSVRCCSPARRGPAEGRLASSHTPLILGTAEAAALERELLEDYRFGRQQLVELCGHASAVAVAKVFPLPALSRKQRIVLVVCGPEQNGAVGLVCARHLRVFEYEPTIFYPTRSLDLLHRDLTTQCEKMDIPFLSYLPTEVQLINDAYRLVVDAVLGPGVEPCEVGGPCIRTLATLKLLSIPLVSLDIPSGWDAETGGGETEDGLRPDVLVSLTAPKRCAGRFSGRHHFVAGRFVPDDVRRKFALRLPGYTGTDCVVAL
nr:yjeF N-terminal domain-containing protein 3 isoform X2 [Manis javanica]